MSINLIGIWKSDPNDEITQKFYGNVILEFTADGNLIYTIVEQNIEQIFMTYEFEGEFLITDQKSHQQKVKTKFFIDVENNCLELIFETIKSKYIKIQ
jgi:hypothetical protein